jgi:1-deoxyxylulose-5-phosphate synthase
MEYVRLGSTGMKVSRLCLGTMGYGSKAWRDWVVEEDTARPLIRRALEVGINFFDSADMYSIGVSEEILGRAVRDFAPSRDNLVITTKVFNSMSHEPNDRGLSRKHILKSIDRSLKRLGMDYVDLYQIHRFDPNTPIEETLQALDDLVRAGKVLYLGASSMYAWQFLKMLEFQKQNGFARFVSMQNHYNLVYREEEREMIPLCRAEGIGLIPWSPLAKGFLMGNRKQHNGLGATLRAQTDEFAHKFYYKASDYRVVDRVTEVAKARGVNNAQIGLAWVLSRPFITAPIIGVSKPEHLQDAVAALDLRLRDCEKGALEELYEPHGIMGHA